MCIGMMIEEMKSDGSINDMNELNIDKGCENMIKWYDKMYFIDSEWFDGYNSDDMVWNGDVNRCIIPGLLNK